LPEEVKKFEDWKEVDQRRIPLPLRADFFALE